MTRAISNRKLHALIDVIRIGLRMVDIIPILFCINARYAQHAAVCIVSLLKNNPDMRFNIVVVASEPLGPVEKLLRDSLVRYSSATLRIVQFTPAKLAVNGNHRSVDAYTRLWVADFFPTSTEKVLYLDSDIVIVGSVRELWYTELGNKLLGATTIPGATTRCRDLGFPERFGYFQSGVLLFNLRKWREENAFDRIVSWLAENPRPIGDDQGALNACFYDKRHVLPDIWNVIVPFYFDYHPLGISEAAREAIRSHARIIHFNEPSKLWHYMNRHPRRDEYWKYLRLTEWRDYSTEDKNLLNWGKRHMGWVVPRTIRASLKTALARTAPE